MSDEREIRRVTDGDAPVPWAAIGLMMLGALAGMQTGTLEQIGLILSLAGAGWYFVWVWGVAIRRIVFTRAARSISETARVAEAVARMRPDQAKAFDLAHGGLLAERDKRIKELEREIKRYRRLLGMEGKEQGDVD